MEEDKQHFLKELAEALNKSATKSPQYTCFSNTEHDNYVSTYIFKIKKSGYEFSKYNGRLREKISDLPRDRNFKTLMKMYPLNTRVRFKIQKDCPIEAEVCTVEMLKKEVLEYVKDIRSNEKYVAHDLVAETYKNEDFSDFSELTVLSEEGESEWLDLTYNWSNDALEALMLNLPKPIERLEIKHTKDETKFYASSSFPEFNIEKIENIIDETQFNVNDLGSVCSFIESFELPKINYALSRIKENPVIEKEVYKRYLKIIQARSNDANIKLSGLPQLILNKLEWLSLKSFKPELMKEHGAGKKLAFDFYGGMIANYIDINEFKDEVRKCKSEAEIAEVNIKYHDSLVKQLEEDIKVYPDGWYSYIGQKMLKMDAKIIELYFSNENNKDSIISMDEYCHLALGLFSQDGFTIQLSYQEKVSLGEIFWMFKYVPGIIGENNKELLPQNPLTFERAHDFNANLCRQVGRLMDEALEEGQIYYQDLVASGSGYSGYGCYQIIDDVKQEDEGNSRVYNRFNNSALGEIAKKAPANVKVRYTFEKGKPVKIHYCTANELIEDIVREIKAEDNHEKEVKKIEYNVEFIDSDDLDVVDELKIYFQDSVEDSRIWDRGTLECLYTALGKGFEKMQFIIENDEVKVQASKEFKDVGISLIEEKQQVFEGDVNDFEKICEFIESANKAKLTTIMDLIRDNESLKMKVEKRYLHFVKARLNNSDAVIEQLPEAMLNKAEINKIGDEDDWMSKGGFYFRWMSDKEIKLMVDLIGSMTAKYVDLEEFHSEGLATTDEKELKKVVKKYGENLKNKLLKEAKVYKAGWYSKFLKLIGSVNLSSLNFDHSTLQETNEALYYDYFMFYVTIPDHWNMKIDIFQSDPPKLSTSFWLAYKLPRLVWGDTTPEIEKSPLKWERKLSSRVE